jgi:putative phosphoribosyl transferase
MRPAEAIMWFTDRRDAGRRLAAALVGRDLESPLVLGLPRGGVPVADEVAAVLRAPLDVLVVRKLGSPHHPELALGALGPDRVVVWNDDVLRGVAPPRAAVEAVVARETAELGRREARFRAGRPPLDVGGRVVVVVDDGIATGATARAAVAWLRGRGASRVVVAAPVGSPDVVAAMRRVADEVVVLEQPAEFAAVGAAYEEFDAVEDDEVVAILAAARRREARSGERTRAVRRSVAIRTRDAVLPGDLVVPERAIGVVVFAHGSGSSRRSPRNREVARSLEEAGIATLLLDLLSEREVADDERTARLRFDVGLLSRRVADTVANLADLPEVRGLPVGLFGASTGAAAALVAAAAFPDDVAAVVSRGGRPDLVAPTTLTRVAAPVLLLVGGEDFEVLALHREVLPHLAVEHRLAVVPGATHLFEEPGALESVAVAARDWFVRHLAAARPEGAARRRVSP